MEPSPRAARAAVEMWRDRLAAAARNLADLNGSDDVRGLRARLSGPDAYEGATLARARRVAASLDGLWADYLLVSRTVEEAEALLRRPLFGQVFGQAREAEAAAMLDGASIRLPAVSVPLRARGLLDAAERSAAVTPAAVLDAMVEGFEAARRGAAAIATAATATRVKLDALTAGIDAEPGAREPALAARLDAAARALDRDPLAAADLVAPLAAAHASSRAAREAAERGRRDEAAALATALAEATARARAGLAALRDARDRGAEARRACEDLLAPEAEAGDPVADLAAWLDRLAAAGAAGRGAAARIGLARWAEACAAALGSAEADVASIAAASRERDDLRGRFRALRAKAEALRARNAGAAPDAASDAAPDPAADPRPVATALAARPFDAARVRALLAGFEAGLGARRRA